MATKLEQQIAEAEAPDDGDGDEGGDLTDAEPDTDAEAEADEGEQAEAEPEPAELEQSQLAIIKELEGEHKRHRKALERIMGDGFSGYDDCPVCLSMGYVPGSPLRQDSKVKTCEHCAGFGQVLTGAIPPGEAVRQCPDCLGNGHVPTTTPDAPAFNFAVAAPTTTPTNGATIDPEVERLKQLGYTVLPPLPTAG